MGETVVVYRRRLSSIQSLLEISRVPNVDSVRPNPIGESTHMGVPKPMSRREQNFETQALSERTGISKITAYVNSFRNRYLSHWRPRTSVRSFSFRFWAASLLSNPFGPPFAFCVLILLSLSLPPFSLSLSLSPRPHPLLILKGHRSVVGAGTLRFRLLLR